MSRHIKIVSHGPNCLDGVTAAVAVTRFHADDDVAVRFSGNNEIDTVLREVRPVPGGDLWITDISWRERETDAHLRSLLAAGMRVYWIDHHRTALERFRTGTIDVPFTDRVLSEEYAASRLTYEYLGRRLVAEGRKVPAFDALAQLVAMADDNDRWIHQVPGSRELAWVVRALGAKAYSEILQVDAGVTYTPRMQEARARVEAEIARSVAVAEASRSERRVGDVTIVTAVCDGHPSEVADKWGKASRNTVIALWDARSLAVSFRRSPDCTVDLSHVAERLGGGGHAAASGAQMPEVRKMLAEAVAGRVASVLE